MRNSGVFAILLQGSTQQLLDIRAAAAFNVRKASIQH